MDRKTIIYSVKVAWLRGLEMDHVDVPVFDGLQLSEHVVSLAHQSRHTRLLLRIRLTTDEQSPQQAGRGEHSNTIYNKESKP